MAGNRAAATEICLKFIDKIIPGSPNRAIWEKTLTEMTDSQFDKFIDDLESNQIALHIFDPNFGKYRTDIDRNFEIAEELGFSFFSKIKLYREEAGRYFRTPNEYMNILLPYRRQVQMWEKKVSIPKDNKSVDELSGQPTGDSKGSKISYPELHIMAAEGLDKNIIELIKYRGGDEEGMRAMNRLIAAQGAVELDALDRYSGTVKSVTTLKNILMSMHLGSTL